LDLLISTPPKSLPDAGAIRHQHGFALHPKVDVFEKSGALGAILEMCFRESRLLEIQEGGGD
jgi:hypothetical protein